MTRNEKNPQSVPTTPADINEAFESYIPPWQSSRLVWSFEHLRPPLLPRRTRNAEVQDSPFANVDADRTESKQRLTAPDVEPPKEFRPKYGLRGSVSVYRWEGVVETVTEDGFRARLTPSQNGHSPSGEIEFTDFAWEEIPHADRALVEQDAVFYWTIARRTNEAGTLSNESLVRFRRLPPITAFHERVARQEASDLLKELGAEDL